MAPRLAPRRSWAKANNPFWSNHVAAWYRSALEAEHYCRKHDLSTTSLMRWTRHLLSAIDRRKRSEHVQNLSQITRRRQQTNKRWPSRYRYGAHTVSGPIALQAFWGMHVEAMNFIGLGHAEHVAAPVSHRIPFDAIAWNTTATKWTGFPCFTGVPGRN